MVDTEFTPALGDHRLTRLYDLAIALLTREGVWRRHLVTQIAPTSSDRILDVGCGTGSLAILLKRRSPDTDIIGLDPDPVVLAQARKKAYKQGFTIEWRNGFLSDDLVEQSRPISKVVSTSSSIKRHWKRSSKYLRRCTLCLSQADHYILPIMVYRVRSLCASFSGERCKQSTELRTHNLTRMASFLG